MISCPHITPIRTSLDDYLAYVTRSDISLFGRGRLVDVDIYGMLEMGIRLTNRRKVRLMKG